MAKEQAGRQASFLISGNDGFEILFTRVGIKKVGAD
jgi:hypothetical protein